MTYKEHWGPDLNLQKEIDSELNLKLWADMGPTHAFVGWRKKGRDQRDEFTYLQHGTPVKTFQPEARNR